MRIMGDYGFAVAAIVAFIASGASLVGFGLLLLWIEDKFGVQIIER